MNVLKNNRYLESFKKDANNFFFFINLSCGMRLCRIIYNIGFRVECILSVVKLIFFLQIKLGCRVKIYFQNFNNSFFRFFFVLELKIDYILLLICC